jgi:hypothetical protein
MKVRFTQRSHDFCNALVTCIASGAKLRPMEKQMSHTIPPDLLTRSGTSRRAMLSMIPVALLAAWQGLTLRPKPNSGVIADPAAQLQIRPDEYSYTATDTVATPLSEPATSDCYTMWTTIYTYDEHGCVVKEQTFAADGSTVHHHHARIRTQE